MQPALHHGIGQNGRVLFFPSLPPCPFCLTRRTNVISYSDKKIMSDNVRWAREGWTAHHKLPLLILLYTFFLSPIDLSCLIKLNTCHCWVVQNKNAIMRIIGRFNCWFCGDAAIVQVIQVWNCREEAHISFVIEHLNADHLQGGCALTSYVKSVFIIMLSCNFGIKCCLEESYTVSAKIQIRNGSLFHVCNTIWSMKINIFPRFKKLRFWMYFPKNH